MNNITTATGAQILDFWHDAPIWKIHWVENMKSGLYSAIEYSTLDPHHIFELNDDFGFVMSLTSHIRTFAEAFTSWSNDSRKIQSITIQIHPGTEEKVLTLLRQHGLLVEEGA